MKQNSSYLIFQCWLKISRGRTDLHRGILLSLHNRNIELKHIFLVVSEFGLKVESKNQSVTSIINTKNKDLFNI